MPKSPKRAIKRLPQVMLDIRKKDTVGDVLKKLWESSRKRVAAVLKARVSKRSVEIPMERDHVFQLFFSYKILLYVIRYIDDFRK
jgi:hypothetical protein